MKEIPLIGKFLQMQKTKWEGRTTGAGMVLKQLASASSVIMSCVVLKSPLFLDERTKQGKEREKIE